VAAEDGEYAGTAAAKFVNWLSGNGGGLQLEQGQTARDTESATVLTTLRELLRDGVV
jgi:hypothetical protein